MSSDHGVGVAVWHSVEPPHLPAGDRSVGDLDGTGGTEVAEGLSMGLEGGQGWQVC